MNEWQMFLATIGYHLRSTKDPIDILSRVRNDKTFVSEVLTGLASHDSSSIRMSVAQHTEANEETLDLLASDTDINVRIAVAKNRRTASRTLVEMADEYDPEVLEALAFSEDGQVRLVVAGNPQCPESIHMQLASDKLPAVRVAMAKNSNCSPQALTSFATNQFYEYRVLAASHPKLPHALFEVLSKDNEISVRAAIVNNNACPFAIRAPLYARQPILLQSVHPIRDWDEESESEIDSLDPEAVLIVTAFHSVDNIYSATAYRVKDALSTFGGIIQEHAMSNCKRPTDPPGLKREVSAMRSGEAEAASRCRC